MWGGAASYPVSVSGVGPREDVQQVVTISGHCAASFIVNSTVSAAGVAFLTLLARHKRTNTGYYGKHLQLLVRFCFYCQCRRASLPVQVWNAVLTESPLDLRRWWEEGACSCSEATAGTSAGHWLWVCRRSHMYSLIKGISETDIYIQQLLVVQKKKSVGVWKFTALSERIKVNIRTLFLLQHEGFFLSQVFMLHKNNVVINYFRTLQ